MNSALIGLLSIAIFIMIAWAISRGIKHYSNKFPPVSGEGTAGVGGWLLLLILGLMFLGPIMGVGRINDGFISAESQYPNLKQVAAWGTYKSATWLAYLIFCSLSFYAGLGLAEGRDTSVVKRAKILLWVIGPGASLFMGLVLPAVIFGRAESDPGTVGAYIGAVIVAVIWTGYLSKSKRVQATYGDGSSRCDTQPVIPRNAAR